MSFTFKQEETILDAIIQLQEKMLETQDRLNALEAATKPASEFDKEHDDGNSE